GQIGEARMLWATVRWVRVDRQYASISDELADRCEEQGPPAVVARSLDHPVRPGLDDQLLVGKKVCRRPGPRMAEPVRALPTKAAPVGVGELRQQALRKWDRPLWAPVDFVGIRSLDEAHRTPPARACAQGGLGHAADVMDGLPRPSVRPAPQSGVVLPVRLDQRYVDVRLIRRSPAMDLVEAALAQAGDGVDAGCGSHARV